MPSARGSQVAAFLVGWFLFLFFLFFFKKKIKQVNLSCGCEGCLGIVGWQDVLSGELSEYAHGAPPWTPVQGLASILRSCWQRVELLGLPGALPLATLALCALQSSTGPFGSAPGQGPSVQDPGAFPQGL